MWYLRTTAAVLLVSCGLCVLGCGSNQELGATTTTTEAQLDTNVPTGWVTIRGKGISLALPATFAGGDAADPDITAAFKRDRGVDAFPEQPPEGFELPLIAWQQTGTGGPWVVVMRVMKPPNVSMEEQVAEYFYRADQFTIVSLSEDRACVLDHSPLVIMGGANHQLDVFVRDGWYSYLVIYACDAGSADVLDPVFTTSAETITIQQ